MSHGGAAGSAMPQHQRRDPTAAGAATGPLAMKMSREGSREGFQGGLFWVPPRSPQLLPRPSPSFRPGRVRPARLRAPTHAGSEAQTFFLLSACCFYLAPPCFGVVFLPPRTLPRFAMGQGWSTQAPKTLFFGGEQKGPKPQTSVASLPRLDAALTRSHLPPNLLPLGVNCPPRGCAAARDKNIPTEVEKGRGKAIGEGC